MKKEQPIWAVLFCVFTIQIGDFSKNMARSCHFISVQWNLNTHYG